MAVRVRRMKVAEFQNRTNEVLCSFTSKYVFLFLIFALPFFRAVLHSKEKWEFRVTREYQVFLETKDFLDLLVLVHKAHLVKRASKVYQVAQGLLEFLVS